MQGIGLPGKRVVRGVRIFLLALVGVLASYVILFPQLFRCQLIGFSDFQPLPGQVFVASQIPVAQHKWILGEVKTAKARIDSMYNGRKSKPIIIVCSTPEQYRTYCSSTEAAGCSLGTPWGSAYVVVNLEGVNADVLSHEFSHTELLAQLGWWSVTFNVPHWFNEGLALMADRRFVTETDPIERYRAYMDQWLYQTRGGQIILELEEIETLQHFFKGDPRQVMTAYMTAGLEVSYWLRDADKKQLPAFLALMNSGASFSKAYDASEHKHTEKYLPANPLRRRLPE